MAGTSRLPRHLFTARYQNPTLATHPAGKVRITLGAPRFRLPYELAGAVRQLAPTWSMSAQAGSRVRGSVQAAARTARRDPVLLPAARGGRVSGRRRQTRAALLRGPPYVWRVVSSPPVRGVVAGPHGPGGRGVARGQARALTERYTDVHTPATGLEQPDRQLVLEEVRGVVPPFAAPGDLDDLPDRDDPIGRDGKRQPIGPCRLRARVCICESNRLSDERLRLRAPPRLGQEDTHPDVGWIVQVHNRKHARPPATPVTQDDAHC